LGESKGILVYYCYILRCADDSFYVGVTDDPEQRVQDHNVGRGASWTAARRPVHLVWLEEQPTLSAARTRENKLKRWSHRKKEVLVRGSPRLRSVQGA
jgi:predicted GIY-YIG superfamily endonuclease